LTKLRKIPQRVCVGCREKKPKKELIRIVRTPEGNVDIDLTGKKSGRGVYICAQKECLHSATKGKKLAKNLKIYVPPEIVEKLYASFEEIQEK